MTLVRLALLPSLALRCDAGAAEGSDVADAAVPALAQAFAHGSGAGLVQLAGRWPAAALAPPEAYWRDFAKAHLTLVLATGAAPFPEAYAAAWLERAPPLPGGEYLRAEALKALWAATGDAAAAAAPLQPALAALSPVWDGIGRVCLSLAENKRDPLRPFAMLATYTTRLTDDAKPQHAPLARVLRQQATEGRTESVAKITDALRAAAERSVLVRGMLDSRRIFQPQALTVAEAHQFLKDLPAMEAAGLMVRVPDWWNAAKPPRAMVSVTVGSGKPKGSGMGALMDFKAEVSLLGQPLTAAEWKMLRDAAAGLVFLRGQWVEADAARIEQVLAVWRSTEALAAREGLTFAQAMRLFVGGQKEPGEGPAGAGRGPGDAPRAGGEAAPDDVPRWSEVVSGRWLKDAVAGLRSPEGGTPPDLGGSLRATLRPYQQAGLTWLWRLHQLGLGGCLADDMGLGKTIQVLAFLAALKRAGAAAEPHLIVAPATLVATWVKEAAKFTPGLRVLAAHPSQTPAAQLRARPEDLGAYDLVVASYGTLQRYEWLLGTPWGVVVLDEAQAIKNPDTRQTRAAKAVQARQRLALTGTPVENQPLDLWSIFDFINPGLLGTARQFAAVPFPALRTLVRPYILRRLKTDRAIAPDLPDKTELEVACGLTASQAALYERIVNELRRDLTAVDGMKRKGVVLAALLKLKQVCGHPALATGHGEFSPSGSGKLQRLLEIADEVAARQERLLVFTQFRSMTAVLDRELRLVFRRPGCVLHGATPVQERQALVERFQADGGPPYFVLSVKAGGTGLTLTAASHVVHFDRWWNPAVEDQATDRAYRIGQHRNVLVHKLTCAGTVEQKVADLIASKRGLAAELLGGASGGEAFLTELGDQELLDLVALDINKATCDY